MSNVFEGIDSGSAANPFEIEDIKSGRLSISSPNRIDSSGWVKAASSPDAGSKSEPIMLGNDPRAIQIDPERAKQMDLAASNMGIRVAGPMMGQRIGMMTGPFAEVATPALGGAFGAASEYIAQRREGGPIRPGAIGGAGFVGAIPGGPLIRAAIPETTAAASTFRGMLEGAKRLSAEGSKWALANTAAKAIETGIDEHRAPTEGETRMAAGSGLAVPVVSKVVGGLFGAGKLNEAAQLQRSLDTAQEGVRKSAKDLGFKTIPSITRKTAINDAIESFGGQPQLLEDVVRHNQNMADAAARADLGLPRGDPNLTQSLAKLQEELGAPYERFRTVEAQATKKFKALEEYKSGSADPHENAVRADNPAIKDATQMLSDQTGLAEKDLGKNMDSLVDRLRSARSAEHLYYQQNDRVPSPETLEKAKAAGELARKLEQQIEVSAKAFGDEKLYTDIVEARRMLAKTYAVENALNPSNQRISAKNLGTQRTNGVPLDGNLKTIADFANSFPEMAQDAWRISYGNNVPSSLLGKAAKASGIPSLMRKTAMSDMARRTPYYGRNGEGFISGLARYGTLEAGRQENALESFLRMSNEQGPHQINMPFQRP